MRNCSFQDNVHIRAGILLDEVTFVANAGVLARRSKFWRQLAWGRCTYIFESLSRVELPTAVATVHFPGFEANTIEVYVQLIHVRTHRSTLYGPSTDAT